VNDDGFTIEPEDDGGYRVRGGKPERWVRQTNFDNDEAIGFLADRLARLGVEEALAKSGAEPGSLVRIGGREFDWQPMHFAGQEYTPGPRGTDYRLDEATSRPTAEERLAARKARRVRSPEQEGGPGNPSETDVD
jgi:GTP-binding protein